jgi:GH25 family lysozyme M1 (1,4-beta-N-acetylmuramidase)
MVKKGIDISTWQANYPYSKAKAEGVEFVIIRAGFKTTKDNQFETHYKNAKAQGWGIGAYWYMYATTVNDAIKEAQAFLNAVKGKLFDYPLYLDLEDNSIVSKTNKATRDAMVNAFCETLEKAGYYVGVYTNWNWFKNLISGAALNKKWDWWIAHWGTNRPTGINYGLWQYRVGSVAGVRTDMDYCYKDYPTIIKSAGKNGYVKQGSSNPNPQTKTVDELAREVIAGKWGNGADRKRRLTEAGYDYNAVQNQVNKILGVSQNNHIYYTVKAGDTFWGIGKKFGIDYRTIMKRNGYTTETAKTLKVGTKLLIK